jgi:hypothetical protein
VKKLKQETPDERLEKNRWCFMHIENMARTPNNTVPQQTLIEIANFAHRARLGKVK